MQRTTTQLARLVAGLVVALLVALAGTTVSVAAPTSSQGAAASGQHQVGQLAVVGAAHRAATPHRHASSIAAAWLGTATPVGTTAHPLAAAVPGGEPVVQTSFCSNDRAPPV